MPSRGGLLSRTTLCTIDEERDTFQWVHDSTSDPLLNDDWGGDGASSPLFEVQDQDINDPPATVDEELAATFRENLHSSYVKMAAVADIDEYHIRLLDILQRHGVSLKCHDDLIELTNEHMASGTFDTDTPPMKKRDAFIKQLEKSLDTSGMLPKHVDVQLHDGKVGYCCRV